MMTDKYAESLLKELLQDSAYFSNEFGMCWLCDRYVVPDGHATTCLIMRITAYLSETTKCGCDMQIIPEPPVKIDPMEVSTLDQRAAQVQKGGKP